jgi:hypothetical protein
MDQIVHRVEQRIRESAIYFTRLAECFIPGMVRIISKFIESNRPARVCDAHSPTRPNYLHLEKTYQIIETATVQIALHSASELD